MTIIGLDPGFTFAYSVFDLDTRWKGAIKLVSFGSERVPGSPKGNDGQRAVWDWALALLSNRFADAAYFASDAPILNTERPTNVAGLGAFNAVSQFCDGKQLHRYPRWVAVNTVGMLAGNFTPFRLTRWKPGAAAFRSAISKLAGRPIKANPHELDAIAQGFTLAYKQLGWKPSGWIDPKITRQIEQHKAAMDLFRR